VSRPLLIGLLVCVFAFSAAGAAANASPAPSVPHPSITGRVLVVRFFTLLEHKDVAGLRAFLAPGFQVQRADGSADDKATYLAHLPIVRSFSISRVTATESNGALVVRYLAVATGLVNGKPYRPGPAPRLSVFTWNSERWQLAAHANFNPL
jgi:hypothetical protein